MKKKLFTNLICLFLLINFQALSQESSKLNFLKGQKNLKIEYDYDSMGVGSFAKEADYINRKVEEYNSKEPGKGDKWLLAWKGDRARVFQPKFETMLNRYVNPELTAGPSFADAQYILVVKTTFTEPGFNAGWPIKKDASINVVYEFFDINDRHKVIAKLSNNNIPGRMAGGFDFDASLRISEAYGTAGKALGKYLATIIK